MASHAFPPPRRPLAAPLHVRLLHRCLRWLLHRLFRIEVLGREHIPARGPYCLAANHLSRFDPLLLLSVFPLQPRVWFLAAAEHTVAVPWRRRFLRWTGGVIPLYDDPLSVRRSLRDAIGALQAGGVVGIFPEGRIGPTEGELQPLEPGAAFLVRRCGVPVLPVWLAGVRQVYWRKRIQIVIGPPRNWSPRVDGSDITRALTAALLECQAATVSEDEPIHPKGLWLNRLL